MRAHARDRTDQNEVWCCPAHPRQTVPLRSRLASCHILHSSVLHVHVIIPIPVLLLLGWCKIPVLKPKDGSSDSDPDVIYVYEKVGTESNHRLPLQWLDQPQATGMT